MRDVSGHRQIGIRDLPGFVARLALHPVEVMQGSTALTLGALITLQVSGAVFSGVAVALMEKSMIDLAIGIFIFPIAMLMIGAIFTLLLYYYFALFAATYLDIRRLHAVVTIATLPYFLVHTFSGFLPPLDLLGFSLTCILCIVGLVEQFGLSKKLIFAFFIFAAILFFVIWSVIQYATNS